MDKPLISVIVPVYNVEMYLEKCIKSILDQSYLNIEIILIDDGSKDGSGKICDAFGRNHENIKVIHKDNAGLGYARNSGLEIMEGKYVAFVDSDDWISKDLIQNMYNSITENNVDFCKSGFQRVKNNGEVLSFTRYDNRVYEADQAAKVLLPRMVGSSPDAHDSLEMCVSAVLYNADIIRDCHIRFPSERILICEDLVFNIDFMQKANGACTTDKLDYYYRMNDASLSHRYRPDRFKASTFFYHAMKKKLSDLGYGNDTFLRLDRMFFIHIRMCIGQERKTISGNDQKTSIRIIDNICNNDSVVEAISEYPIERLGIRQRLFLQLLKRKKSWLLYQFAKRKLL